jgi:hypothetical protein
VTHSTGATASLSALVLWLAVFNAPAVEAAEIPSQGGTTVAAEACGWVGTRFGSCRAARDVKSERADPAPPPHLQSYQCPETAPCCSNSGYCSSGVACLAGCDPLGSHNTSYCAPQPVCSSSNYTFADDSRLNYNISGYNGDASKFDWTVDTVSLLDFSLRRKDFAEQPRSSPCAERILSTHRAELTLLNLNSGTLPTPRSSKTASSSCL